MSDDKRYWSEHAPQPPKRVDVVMIGSLDGAKLELPAESLRQRLLTAEKRVAELEAILRKLRTHSSRVQADGDYYAAFNYRYLDEIDAILPPPPSEKGRG